MQENSFKVLGDELLERDLQEYLFANPDVLFPSETISDKSREFYIQGKRIDLLIRIGDVRYIIELKAVPLSREHIGQVLEYYGLMRNFMREGNFRMVLVAPFILESRKVFLEEIGIRCVEIPNVPTRMTEIESIRKDVSTQRKREQLEAEVATWLPDFASIRYEDLVTVVTKRSLAISHRVLRDSLDNLRRGFSEYEMLPIKMKMAGSHDMICEGVQSNLDSALKFVRGGAWWAYAFGESEEMPKNDVPNISAIAMPWCFDLTINAELQTSQAVMKERITAASFRFDKLLSEHGAIQFQALLKLEHQPRFHHWILLTSKDPDRWNANTFLDVCREVDRDYDSIRDSWIARIKQSRPDLSENQAIHMKRANKRPNLALRLVRSFRRDDEFWSLPYSEQHERFVNECLRLKPFIDFFR